MEPAGRFAATARDQGLPGNRNTVEKGACKSSAARPVTSPTPPGRQTHPGALRRPPSRTAARIGYKTRRLPGFQLRTTGTSMASTFVSMPRNALLVSVNRNRVPGNVGRTGDDGRTAGHNGIGLPGRRAGRIPPDQPRHKYVADLPSRWKGVVLGVVDLDGAVDGPLVGLASAPLGVPPDGILCRNQDGQREDNGPPGTLPCRR